MTHETRSPEEIERDIERDRAQLTDNLDTLQDKFSIDGFIGQVSDQLREHGGEIGQSLTRTVKENPAAVALTGIGLAWMIFGNKSSTQPSGRDTYPEAGGYSGSRAAVPASPRSTSMSRPDPSFKGGSEGLPSWARSDSDEGESYADKAGAAVSTARDSVTATANQAGEKLRDAHKAVGDKAGDAGSKLSSSVDQAKETVAQTAQSAQRRAEDMRARLSEGTETLSEEARTRVIAAREAAMDAHRKASEALSRSSEQAADLYDRQPLVMGALAVAVGAAIGSAAPRTQKEDELLGAHSDRMMDEAERIFHEEREKAAAVMNAAKDEAQNIVKEKKADLDSGAPGDKSAGKAVADEAKAAGQRVAQTAKDKAEKEGLGKVSS